MVFSKVGPNQRIEWGQIRPIENHFCFQSERLLYGREPNGVRCGTGKAEDREAAGRRN